MVELCIQMAGLIQSAIEEPIAVDGLTIYLSCSIGFCPLSRAPGSRATDWQDAANAALRDAIGHGPSAIREFSVGMLRENQTRNTLRG